MYELFDFILYFCFTKIKKDAWIAHPFSLDLYITGRKYCFIYTGSHRSCRRGSPHPLGPVCRTRSVPPIAAAPVFIITSPPFFDYFIPVSAKRTEKQCKRFRRLLQLPESLSGYRFCCNQNCSISAFSSSVYLRLVSITFPPFHLRLSMSSVVPLSLIHI